MLLKQQSCQVTSAGACSAGLCPSIRPKDSSGELTGALVSSSRGGRLDPRAPGMGSLPIPARTAGPSEPLMTGA